MANLYSKYLGGGAFAGGGTSTIGIVPAGVIWVVRNVDYIFLPVGGLTGKGAGIYIHGADGFKCFSIGAPDVVGGRAYHLEGRQVFNTGDTVQVFAYEAGWGYRVSGYELSAP